MELSTVPYYSKCWFKNHQVKAVLGVGAFLSLSIIIFCSYCSRARSHLCDVMKWGMERGKRKVSHLKCTCQFILLFLLLQLGLEILHYRIPHWAKECMKTSQEPSGPLPHSIEHAPFQNTGWKIWGQRDWNKDTAWWEEWVRETCEWLGEEKVYLRICTSGRGSCLTSPGTTLVLDGSTLGSLTWKLGT